MKKTFYLFSIFAVFLFISCSKRNEDKMATSGNVSKSVKEDSRSDQKEPKPIPVEAINSEDKISEAVEKADIIKPPVKPSVPDPQPPTLSKGEEERLYRKLAYEKAERELRKKRKGEAKIKTDTLSARKESLLSSLDEALEDLSKGTIAFNVPQKIKYKSTAAIHLVLSPIEEDKEVVKLVESKGEIVSKEIRFSKFLEARLEGKNFEIEAITAKRQPVSLKDTTQWRWEITPLKAGKESLYLNIYAVVNIDGEKHERLLKTFTKEMLIEITFLDHPVEYLKHKPSSVYISLATGAGILFFLFRFLKAGRKRTALGETVSIGSKNVYADIFISYSSKDRNISTKLTELLRAKGLSVWMDVGGIAPAALWTAEIVNALKSAKVVVLVGSVNSFQSHNVVKEVSIASEQQTPIIPLIIDNSEIPDKLAYQLAGVQVIRSSEDKIAESAEMISQIIMKEA